MKEIAEVKQFLHDLEDNAVILFEYGHLGLTFFLFPSIAISQGYTKYFF